MSDIAIRLIEVPFGEMPKYDDLQVGDMWLLTGKGEDELRNTFHLTDHYFKHNASRHPLMLALPMPASRGKVFRFLVDGKCYNNERGYYDGWTVSGHPPFISISPSVDIQGIYHGYIGSNGVAPGFIGPDLNKR